MVERFEPNFDKGGGAHRSENGSYVRYSDYAELEAQLAKLGAENERLARVCNFWQSQHDERTRQLGMSDTEATPPAPKVMEIDAAVRAAKCHLYNNGDGKPSFIRECDLRAAIRAALTAAQEAGKPSTPEGQQCRCDKCNAVIELDVHVPDEIWKRISPKPIDGYKGGGLLCAQCVVDALTRPSEQAVTEAMVEALKEARSVIYDTQQSCLYDDDDGQVGVTEDAVISPYHFQKICNSLKVIDEALKAAMEAGR